MFDMIDTRATLTLGTKMYMVNAKIHSIASQKMKRFLSLFQCIFFSLSLCLARTHTTDEKTVERQARTIQIDGKCIKIFIMWD